MESLSSNFQYKGLNTPGTDNEDEDFPPEFTTLAHEQEKCEFILCIFVYIIDINTIKDFSILMNLIYFASKNFVQGSIQSDSNNFGFVRNF